MAPKQQPRNEFEALVEAMADHLVSMVKSLPVASVPFGAVPLSRDEQSQRYSEMRDDPAAWETLIRERGHREALRYARTMERIMRRTEESKPQRPQYLMEVTRDADANRTASTDAMDIESAW